MGILTIGAVRNQYLQFGYEPLRRARRPCCGRGAHGRTGRVASIPNPSLALKAARNLRAEPDPKNWQEIQPIVTAEKAVSGTISWPEFGVERASAMMIAPRINAAPPRANGSHEGT